MELLDYLPWVAVVAVCVLLLPYVLGPILIRATLKQSAVPEVATFEPDNPRIPKAVARHFAQVTEELQGEGFEVVQGLVLPEQTPNVKAFILMFANRKERDAAIATAMYVDGLEGRKLQTAYVEIVSRFHDGQLIQTNNTSELGAFPPRPGHTTIQLPMVQEAARLYRLHHALADEHGSRTDKTLRLDDEFHGDAAAYLEAAIVEELEAQLDTGYMYLSRSESAFRPTMKGAFLMTWGMLWPFKALRSAARDRRGLRLIARLERDLDDDHDARRN